MKAQSNIIKKNAIPEISDILATSDLAACPSFDVLKETNQLRKEVIDELKK